MRVPKEQHRTRPGARPGTGPVATQRRRKRRVKKKNPLGLYKIAIIIILVFGGIYLGSKLYQLWKIHQDMQLTIQQEQILVEENEKLSNDKARLEDPEEVSQRAREQFGLVKPGEVPYKR